MAAEEVVETKQEAADPRVTDLIERSVDTSVDAIRIKSTIQLIVKNKKLDKYTNDSHNEVQALMRKAKNALVAANNILVAAQK